MEPYGVTYWAYTARAWITHGSLTAPLGLTATLMYGFSAPDGSSWIMAGSIPGVVSDVAASGAWTGYLFGLVQVGGCGGSGLLGLAAGTTLCLGVGVKVWLLALSGLLLKVGSWSKIRLPGKGAFCSSTGGRWLARLCRRLAHIAVPCSQDLDKTDSEADTLSLAYADEDRQYNADGSVAMMNLQLQVS